MGYEDRAGTPGLASRMFRHVNGGVGRELRPARRGRRPGFSAPRKRDWPIRIPDRQAFRAFLVSRPFSAGRTREDVEERRDFLYPSRSRAERSQAFIAAVSARIRGISQPAYFHI